MLKRVALIAPCALIVAASACGGESQSTTGEDLQRPPQVQILGGGGPSGGPHGNAGGGAGTGQYSCMTDADCARSLGFGVAICDFEPTVGLGQCVSPNW